MYARSTTVRGNPMAMDDVIAYVRDEVMPALLGMSGCVGLSMLADREGGRCIITSAWADETSMHATDQSVQDFRRRAAEIMDGEQHAQAWEIALLHRMHEGHDGACTRVVWGESDPARAQDNMETLRVAMLPRMEELPGFCSVSLMIDRATGRSAMSTTYDSRADLDRATEAATALREELTPAMGVHVTDMAIFDLVLHHLRVPETV
jgi:quinol monooxygenase YgiN